MSLTFDEARHFLSRTAFGGTPEEIRCVMQLDRAAAVEQALAIPMNKAQRKTFHEGLKADGQELKAWWYRELLFSRCPLLLSEPDAIRRSTIVLSEPRLDFTGRSSYSAAV